MPRFTLPGAGGQRDDSARPAAVVGSGQTTEKPVPRSRHPRSWTERTVRRFYYKYFARNLLYELQVRARNESVDYIRAHMADAMMFEDRRDLLDWCMARLPPEGLVLEFGVAAGASLRRIAAATTRTVYGFDSFEGLPEDWSGTLEPRGKFSTGGAAPRVPANVTLVPGWFEDTVPRFAEAHGEAVAFAHLDCDLYSSTRTVLRALGGRFRPGSILVFDEYFNYPNWQRHEFRAFQEFVGEFGVAYRYLGFSIKNGHVAVEITATEADAAGGG